MALALLCALTLTVSIAAPTGWGVPPSAATRVLVQELRGGDNVLHPTTMVEFEDIIKGADPDTLVVVDFTATWCGPCKMIGPHFQALADENAPLLDLASVGSPSVIFVKVDADQVRAALEEFEVAALPTFLFLKGGKEVSRFSGADIQQLKATVEKHSA